MLMFRAWEIRTLRIKQEDAEGAVPEISFRHIEKSMLYLTKHVVQGIVITGAKYWFIVTTKSKKWVAGKWPKIHRYVIKKSEVPNETKSPSFVQRAVLESKAKIKRIKEKVKKEHGEENQ